MMNFREELNKIKEQKSHQKDVDAMLIQVLGYFRAEKKSDISKTVEIFFAKGAKNTVYGRVYICEQLDRSANFVVTTESDEEAFLLLVLLQQQFKEEGFKTLPDPYSASKDKMFSVIIDF